MFGSKQRKIDKLELENANLLEDIQILKDRLSRREEKTKNLSEVLDEVYKSSFSFDFKGGKAFSIERIHDWDDDIDGYLPVTVIGYIKQEGENEVVGEWRFYCSQKEHDRLVSEFNATIKKAK